MTNNATRLTCDIHEYLSRLPSFQNDNLELRDSIEESLCNIGSLRIEHCIICWPSSNRIPLIPIGTRAHHTSDQPRMRLPTASIIYTAPSQTIDVRVIGYRNRGFQFFSVFREMIAVGLNFDVCRLRHCFVLIFRNYL